VKSVHLVGFIIEKFVTMHGHMNEKQKLCRQYVLKVSKLYCEGKDNGVLYQQAMVACRAVNSTPSTTK